MFKKDIKYELGSYKEYKKLTKGSRKILKCCFCRKSPKSKLAHKMLYIKPLNTTEPFDGCLILYFRFCNETCFNCFVLNPKDNYAVVGQYEKGKWVRLPSYYTSRWSN